MYVVTYIFHDSGIINLFRRSPISGVLSLSDGLNMLSDRPFLYSSFLLFLKEFVPPPPQLLKFLSSLLFLILFLDSLSMKKLSNVICLYCTLLRCLVLACSPLLPAPSDTLWSMVYYHAFHWYPSSYCSSNQIYP